MSAVMTPCPICWRSATRVYLPENDLARVDCAACLRFKVDGLTEETRLKPKGARTNLERAILSHSLRIAHQSKEVPRVSSEWIDSVLSEAKLPSPSDQAQRIVTYIGDRVRETGEEISAGGDFCAFVGALDEDRLSDLFEELEKRGLVKGTVFETGDETEFESLDLTLEGWDLYEAEKRGRFSGTYGFLALKFGDAELDRLVADVLKPRLFEQLGYEIRDMRDLAQIGIIDNIMRERIRDAAFVIVDLTHDNAGAYWEAGYAEGLGKPVLYMCKRAKFDDAQTHFDTNHLTTVLWDSERPDEFVPQLVATLRRSLNLFGDS